MREHEGECTSDVTGEECCCGMFPVPDFAEWIQPGVEIRITDGKWKGMVGKVIERIEPHYAPAGAVVELPFFDGPKRVSVLSWYLEPRTKLEVVK